jgi:hypothetical protein
MPETSGRAEQKNICMNISNTVLLIAGVLSLGVAVFQVVVSFVPQWSAAFDAGDELVSNPPLLLATGLLMTLFFGIFGLCGLSGAGAIRPLLLMRLGLLGIGAIYTLRGIAFVPQLLVVLEILPSPQAVAPVHPLVSSVALIVGVFYLAGVTKGWIRMSARAICPFWSKRAEELFKK